MNKNVVLSSLRKSGDAVITVAGKNILATIDFDNKYIKSKRRQFVKFTRDNILVFNWTDNKFDLLNAKDIKYINPLQKVLNNNG